MVRLEEFESPASGFVVQCSIQLSYKRVYLCRVSNLFINTFEASILSSKHGESMIVICKQCGSEFHKIPSHIEKSPNHFCSKSCAAKHNNSKKPKRIKQSHPCKGCGTIITGQNAYCKSCSDACVYCKITDINQAESDSTRRRILLETRGHQCETCKTTEWMGKPVAIELHHIDGDSGNNDITNLILVCPNCHAQTPNFRQANTGNSKRNRYRREAYAKGQQSQSSS